MGESIDSKQVMVDETVILYCLLAHTSEDFKIQEQVLIRSDPISGGS
jgi:hypothetical protein